MVYDVDYSGMHDTLHVGDWSGKNVKGESRQSRRFNLANYDD